MSENPYGPLTIRFGDLRYVDKAMHDAWQQGHDSRDAEVAALKAELAELRDLAQALVRATRLSLQGEATVSVAEGAADEVEEWLEEHK